jgi:hypothetical protein
MVSHTAHLACVADPVALAAFAERMNPSLALQAR